MSVFTPEELKTLKNALTDLIREFESLLDATEAGSQPVKLKDNQGRLSRMDEIHNQSILKANRTLTTNRLHAARAAMIKFDEGFYGYCDSCDEPIAFNRLMAYPDASLCIECQSQVESH